MNLIHRSIKYGLLSAVLAMTACQSDFHNTIPESEKDITVEFEKIKRLLTSIDGNGKIWLTLPQLNYVNQYKYTHRDWGSATPFFVGYDFDKDGGVKIYATIRHYVYQTKSDSTAQVYDNPNRYSVAGDLRVELTILSKGILSKMKEDGAMDFNYSVESYAPDKITLNPIYTQTTNNSFSIVPYDFEKFRRYNKLCEYLYSRSNYYTSIIEGNSWRSLIITNKSNGAEDVFRNNATIFNSWGSLISEMIYQNYDEDQLGQELVFKISDDIDLMTTGGVLLNIRDKLKEYGIKYLKLADLKELDTGGIEAILESYTRDVGSGDAAATTDGVDGYSIKIVYPY